jgi:biotin carboxyl carrier protein
MADKHKTKTKIEPEIKNMEFVQLKVESGSYKTTLPKKFKQRHAYTPVNPCEIYAFIPGTILKINVKAGDEVKKGDLIMVFNAMKMNNEIFSPVNGIVKAVNANEGDRVPKSQLIIELEEHKA